MKLARAVEIIQRGGCLHREARKSLERRLEQYRSVDEERKSLEFVLRVDLERKKSLTKRGQ